MFGGCLVSIRNPGSRGRLLYEARGTDTAASTADVEPGAGICCSHSDTDQGWSTEGLDAVTTLPNDQAGNAMTLLFTQTHLTLNLKD